MNGFERRKQQKKQSIERAALELFEAHGFSRVSISDIAQKAGVSQVTIYNHFGSKEALIRKTIRDIILTLYSKYAEVIKSDKPFLEKLQFIVFDKTRMAEKFQGELIRTAISSDPELRNFIEQWWHGEFTRLLVDFFEDGRKQGAINPELSNESILVFYEIMRKGIWANPEILAKLEHNPRLMKDLIALFTYGLNG